MFSSNSRYDAGSIWTVLKILIGFGIVMITMALILLFNQMLSGASQSIYLQLAVDGCVIMIMSFLSLRIFERL